MTQDHKKQARVTTSWPSTFNNKIQTLIRQDTNENENIITCMTYALRQILKRDFRLSLCPVKYQEKMFFSPDLLESVLEDKFQREKNYK